MQPLQRVDALAYADPRRLTRDEYERMARLGFFAGERVELIRGIVVRMSPIGPPHADAVDRLLENLFPPLMGRARVRIQQPFAAADHSEPEPDVAIVPVADYAERHPAEAFLIVEVADSSIDHDRETKTAVYAASSVQEYWIVDLNARVIEVYRDADGDKFSTVEFVRGGESIAPRAFPDLVIAASRLLR